MEKNLEYDEDNTELYNEIEDYRKSQLEVFKECPNCFAFKTIFDLNNHFAVRQLLLSRFLGIFQCSLDSSQLKEVLYNLNNYASTVVMEEPKRLPSYIEKELKEVIHYKAAAAAYKKLGMDIEILHDLKYELFIFPIRSKFLGITLFGGTVLLNSSLFDRDEDLSRCFQKITFVHEIAHLIRRRSNNGFYDAKIKTPNVSGMLTPGSPGYINANEAMMCDEGGQQLERELFGFYVTEVNMNHIKYINKNANWNKELPDFKDGLANMFDETLFTYHYCRAEDLLYRIDRLSHSEA